VCEHPFVSSLDGVGALFASFAACLSDITRLQQLLQRVSDQSGRQVCAAFRRVAIVLAVHVFLSIFRKLSGLQFACLYCRIETYFVPPIVCDATIFQPRTNKRLPTCDSAAAFADIAISPLEGLLHFACNYVASHLCPTSS
jgi:hypothetical protein